jgi:hypothetical protein
MNYPSIKQPRILVVPDSSSKLIMLFIRLVEIMTSSNTGTLPPTSPVLPPCGHTAKFSALQYLRIADTSSVVLGLSTIWLAPENGETHQQEFTAWSSITAFQPYCAVVWKFAEIMCII